MIFPLDILSMGRLAKSDGVWLFSLSIDCVEQTDWSTVTGDGEVMATFDVGCRWLLGARHCGGHEEVFPPGSDCCGLESV